MGIYNRKFPELNLDTVKSAFNRKKPTFESAGLRGDDFSEFLIQELDPNKTDDTAISEVKLFGNFLPHAPFSLSGSQTLSKDYYPGNPEPVVQYLGVEEDDVTINGELKATRFSDQKYYDYPNELRNILDVIRNRGNVCKFTLSSTWIRYGMLLSTNFEITKLSRIKYSLTFSIISPTRPKNVKFLEQSRNIPNALRENLIDAEKAYRSDSKRLANMIPDKTISDHINQLTTGIAENVRQITDYIEGIVAKIDDVRRSITNAKGLIHTVQRKIANFQGSLKQIQSFNDPNRPIGNQYAQAQNISSTISLSVSLAAIINDIKEQLQALEEKNTATIHTIRPTETPQSISSLYFGVSSKWKDILQYNDLPLIEPLSVGNKIEIPEA